MVKYTTEKRADVEKSYMVQYVNDEKSLNIFVIQL